VVCLSFPAFPQEQVFSTYARFFALQDFSASPHSFAGSLGNHHSTAPPSLTVSKEYFEDSASFNCYLVAGTNTFWPSAVALSSPAATRTASVPLRFAQKELSSFVHSKIQSPNLISSRKVLIDARTVIQPSPPSTANPDEARRVLLTTV
jgi:hypothetical protein